jgi:hypothetical protein
MDEEIISEPPLQCTPNIPALIAPTALNIVPSVKASAKTLSSYFVVFAYIAYNLAQS